MSIKPSTILIKSQQADYEVIFVESMNDAMSSLAKIPDSRILIDRNVAHLYAKYLGPLLEARPHLLIDATEEEKTLAGVERVVTWLQETGANAKSQLVAVGGGIVQDIAAFAAKIYYRSIRWHFVPTTLLSMADSCIGAKCGINLNKFKNQLGAFHAPQSVIVCALFCDTLKEGDMLSGHGEILKLALTDSAANYEYYTDIMKNKGLRSDATLGLIFRSLQTKKVIIEADEYESDLRRVLNYGHSFGHALEAITNNAISHGIGVAYGMDIVNYISYKKGLLEFSIFEQIHLFIASHFSARWPTPVSAKELVDAAKKDKKVDGASINLALLTGFGKLRVVPTVFDQELISHLTEYLRSYNVFYRH